MRRASFALAPGLVSLAMLAVYGCGAPGSEAARSSAALGVATPPGESPYREVVDVRQLMTWILDPAAELVWDSAGAVITIEGEQDLAPQDDEGWAAVRDAAAVVAESGNLLMMPGRARDLDDWAGYARDMIVMGQRAMAAADAQDGDALFEAGGALYTVCLGCHEQYWRIDPITLTAR